MDGALRAPCRPRRERKRRSLCLQTPSNTLYLARTRAHAPPLGADLDPLTCVLRVRELCEKLSVVVGSDELSREAQVGGWAGARALCVCAGRCGRIPHTPVGLPVVLLVPQLTRESRRTRQNIRFLHSPPRLPSCTREHLPPASHPRSTPPLPSRPRSATPRSCSCACCAPRWPPSACCQSTACPATHGPGSRAKSSPGVCVCFWGVVARGLCLLRLRLLLACLPPTCHLPARPPACHPPVCLLATHMQPACLPARTPTHLLTHPTNHPTPPTPPAQVHGCAGCARRGGGHCCGAVHRRAHHPDDAEHLSLCGGVRQERHAGRAAAHRDHQHRWVGCPMHRALRGGAQCVCASL